jgi:Spy/CpxP family protein refolding chaperone
MNMTLFGRPGMRAAKLALCTTVLWAMPMMAQDNATPPPTQEQTGRMSGHGGHGRMEEHQIAMLTKKLNLTPDQVTQVKAIDDDAMKQAMAVRDDTSIAKPDKRAKMMDIHKAAQDKIRGVLTEEQKPKFDALQAEMQARMSERRQGHGSGTDSAPPSQTPQ